MKNKRVTQKRGIALLLAGSMMLSAGGAAPAFAEEYAAEEETVAATPETALESVEKTAEPTSEAALFTAGQPIALYSEETTQNISVQDSQGTTSSASATIDFSDVSNLETDLHGWTYTNGGGETALVDDEEKGQVLKMSRTGDGNETALVYDALNITENDTRYVSVTIVTKLASNGYAHQYSVPYIFDENDAVAYSLFTNEEATQYQSHVNGKNATDAGTLHTDTWQTVRMDIDMQTDTFSVTVDGLTTLRNVKARTATDNLKKIKFYADSWNRGTLYIKSIEVTAGNTAPTSEHTGATAYYVSNSGDDTMDGKTPQTAWKTIARVNREVYIPGDKILFERGGTWENITLQPQGSGSADNYITIGAYGDEALQRPKIAANGKVADAVYLYNQQYWEISDLDISNTVDGFLMTVGDENPAGNVSKRNDADGGKLGDYRGIHIAGSDVATLQGFKIHGVRVHDVSGIVSWIGNVGLNDAGIGNNYGFDRSKRTGGILIESLKPTTNTPTVFSNITIYDNEFVNNSFGGIIVKQYNNGKNQQNGTGWANRNGAGGAPDYYDANWHPHHNIVITGNYINQGGSAYACNGVYLCGVKDSVVEKNLLEHIGTCGIELFFADNVAVQYNEISDVVKKCGGADDNAIDPDWRATNILIQYNYVHGCGEGVLLCGVAFNSGIVRNNLIQDCGRSYIHYSMGNGYFQIANNVFYRSKNGNGTANFDPWGGGTASYVNNVFYDGKETGFNFSGGSNFSYYNNAYYGTAACAKDSNPIRLTENPFVGTAPSMGRKGTVATGALLEANGLAAKPSSALVAAGANADGTKTPLNDGMLAKGSKLNFTSLREKYGSTLVKMDSVAYPVFDQKDESATLATKYTQAIANAAAPTIGMFEVAIPTDVVYLRGTVHDELNHCANASVTVKVNGETVETITDAAGSFFIAEGLTAGEAEVTVKLADRDATTKMVSLESGKINTVEITVPMPSMPDAYTKTLLDENFDNNSSDVFNFASGTAFENGELVLTKGMGNYASSVITFPENVRGSDAVDFNFDYRYENSCNKGGFQFRDAQGNLLFAMCISTTKGQMRYSTTADAITDDEQAGWDNNAVHPTWSYVPADASKTYTVRVRADFAAGTVSYQIKDKETDKILVQQLNASTTAKNLEKMFNCSWYDSRPQYVDDFVLTVPQPVDKTALQTAVGEHSSKQESDYTTETWTVFANALANAKAVLEDENATQTAVDNVLAVLTNAASALQEKPEPAPIIRKVENQPLTEETIPAALKAKGYSTPEKIAAKLKQEISAMLDTENLVVYDVHLKISTDGGATWIDADTSNFPTDGLEVGFELPDGITADTAVNYSFLISHMKPNAEVELLTPTLKDNKLVVKVYSLSPFGISWKAKRQPSATSTPTPVPTPNITPAPSATPQPAATQAPTATNDPAATQIPAAVNNRSASATATPKPETASASTAKTASIIPRTADDFPLSVLAMLALCGLAGIGGLVILRRKKH